MEQVKTFLKCVEEKDDAEKLESRINKWFKENPNIIIKQRFQKVLDEDYVLVTFFYEEAVSL